MTKWRRTFMESTRQTLKRDKHFTPTSTSRVLATFQETKVFADALKKFDKQTTQHVKEVKNMFKVSDDFLSTQVPRMHTEVSPGQVSTQDEEVKVGSTVDFEKLKTASEAGTQRIHTYVLNPLRKWLQNYEQIVLAMSEVNSYRLLLDSRRRSVAALEGKVTKVRSGVEDENDPKLEKFVQQKHRQEMKMNQVLEDFKSKEAATYQNLVSLVNDVKYVQQHMHKLFELHREIYTDGCEAFVPRTGVSGKIAAHEQVPSSERHIPVYSAPGTQTTSAYEQDILPPIHSQSDHGPGVTASNDGYSYNNNQRDGYGDQYRKQSADRYGGAVNESGGYNPV